MEIIFTTGGELIICYRVSVLPDFLSDGNLPPGVHLTDWKSFEQRFGTQTASRVWLCSRLKALVDLQPVPVSYADSLFEEASLQPSRHHAT